MIYINQLERTDLTYIHNTDCGGPPEGRNTVATSGCGLCCASMVVAALTCENLDVAECVKLSEGSGANHCLGTDMKILGPVVAEKYGLLYRNTNELADALECLRRGGQVIAHVSHPAEGVPGLFTMRGHYILLTSCDGDDFCILDPSYKEGKFDIPERTGKVDDSRAPYLYCKVNTVHAETKPTRYHLFVRRK